MPTIEKAPSFINFFVLSVTEWSVAAIFYSILSIKKTFCTMQMAMVRTRIAPSPTGEDIHIGNLYTALINFAVAKKNKGKFIVRIEDTDRERYVAGAEEKILSSLKAFGILYDEGPDIGGPFAPYRQSERRDIYQKYAEELVEKEKAYYCFCTKERLDTLRAKQQEKKQLPRYDKFCLHNVADAKERIAKNDARLK